MNDERLDEIISEAVNKIEPMTKNHAASIYAKYEEKRLKKRHFFIGLISYAAVACATFILCFSIMFPLRSTRRDKANPSFEGNDAAVMDKASTNSTPQQDYLYFSTKPLSSNEGSKAYVVTTIQNIESLYFEIGESLTDVEVDGDGFVFEETKDGKNYLVVENISIYDVITLKFEKDSTDTVIKAFVNGLDTGYYYNFK